MANESAKINSPEIIKSFREDFVRFDSACKSILLEFESNTRKTIQWLHHEQRPYWKRQLRKREEMVKIAQSEYIRARHGSHSFGKTSCIDQKKALEKAKRLKQEAEVKMDLVKKWIQILDSEIEKKMGPVKSLSNLLYQLTPRALNRLDNMAENLENYLQRKRYPHEYHHLNNHSLTFLFYFS